MLQLKVRPGTILELSICFFSVGEDSEERLGKEMVGKDRRRQGRKGLESIGNDCM